VNIYRVAYTATCIYGDNGTCTCVAPDYKRVLMVVRLSVSSPSKPRRRSSWIVLDTHTDLIMVIGRVRQSQCTQRSPASSCSTIAPPNLLSLRTQSCTLAIALLSVSDVR
jgi:hypothetical protein